MLKEFDFGKKSKYSDLKLKDLRKEFGVLQRKIKLSGSKVLILIEGFESSGKGYVISELVNEVNHKYVKVNEYLERKENENKYPGLYRYWENIPGDGEISIFDRSYYYNLMRKFDVTSDFIKRQLDIIYNFEQDLFNDSTIILKFFLNVSKKEQKKRIKNYLDSYKRVLISERDLDQLDNFKKYFKYYDHILEKTDFEFAKWTVVDAEDRKTAAKEILARSIEKLTFFLNNQNKPNTITIENKKKENKDLNNYVDFFENADYSKFLSEEEYDKEKKKLEKDLHETMYELYIKKIPSILIFEGVDAAGKGGAIQRLVRNFDPRLYRVVPISKPTEYEYNYHYMKRFWDVLAEKGRMVVFDRSWYGRVLVERIEGFASEKRWKDAYDEINRTEKYLFENDFLIIKYFLSIDKDTQLSRFRDRENDPNKRYKITEEDWRNREKWDEYTIAYNDMLNFTSKKDLKWNFIPANDKKYARIEVMKIFLESSKKHIERIGRING